MGLPSLGFDKFLQSILDVVVEQRLGLAIVQVVELMYEKSHRCVPSWPQNTGPRLPRDLSE
jgi:hypothetical protein